MSEQDMCSRCGGDLPAPLGRELDALDDYLVRDDANCQGYLRVDAQGEVLGCGMWSTEAYER